MSYELIEVETRGAVGVIRKNRPEKLNAWSREMAAEEQQAMTDFNNDPQVAAIVFAGNGRAYCAGLDLQQQQADVSSGNASRRAGQADEHDDTYTDFCVQSKPIIGAIHGYAVGVGVTTILPFDFRIAGESAQFGFRFVKMGLLPEAASTTLLPRLVGVGRALDWCLTGRFVGAHEALEAGLVREVVPDDDLLDRAIALGEELAENPDSIMRRVKSLFSQNQLESNIGLVQQREGKALEWAMQTPEHAEAIAAFLEKRPAKFR
ncbi:MAG: enoyl-CoA hydratase [Chloroflexi bacterium]|nr:enoyl-CoA hydratase [Chloroflexota bacterium]MYF80361.1 enoyl-CoA hydratase [Chloroflexota bacterium]MYI05526.1 enoyl-CoA hydratase [Chloroflexota bacterium]